MIKLYKKENNKEVEIESLDKATNPFIISLDETDEVLNTSITNKNNNENIDIIGIKYFDDSNISKTEEIVNRIILPFIRSNKTNKLNFIATGDNVTLYKVIESILELKIKDLGCNQEQTNCILSRITLIYLLSKVDTSILKSGSIVFTDVNNKETETEFTEDYKNILKETERDSIFDHYGSINNVIYIHKGTENNNYSDYLNNKAFQSVLSYILEQATDNKYKSANEILNILGAKEYTEDLIKYEFNYIKQKNDAEIAIETALDLTKLYKTEEALKKEKEETIEKLIANIKEYTSDTTYNQILMASGLFGSFEDASLLNAPSDRQIRSYYEQIMSNSDEDEKKNTK